MFARLKSFSTLRPYVAENRRLLLLGAVTLVLANYLDVKVLVLLGKGVDLIGWNLGPFAGIHAQLLTVFLLLLGALAIAAAVARFWMRWLIIGASRQIEFKYRDDLFRHLEGLSASFFSRYSTGDIMSRSTNDLESVRLVIGPAVMYISGTMVMLPMSLYQMIQISGWLTFCTWAPLVLVAPLFYFFNHRIHARFTRAQEIFSDISTRVQETLTGIRVIKVYAREEQEAKRFGELSLRYVDENVRLALLQAYFIPLMGFIISLSMLALIWVGGVMIVHQTAEAAGITLGSLIALFVLLMANIWPLAAIGWVFSMVERGSASMERLNKLFDEKSEIVDSPAGIELLKSAAEGNGAAQGTPAALRLRGELECRNLTFTYPGAANPSLRDINFRLGAGQILGLTGPVGCGKSTLAALLARRFNPQATSLLVDGRDILDWPLREYRRQVSIVDQEPFLFSDTIAANICYGLPSVDLEVTERASQIARFADEAKSFPKGYETLLGERGINLSGGQRQRAALARALATEPALLLLDDALAAVDTHTEEEILKRLRVFMEGRTTIIISHRISTVSIADHILYLESGRIAEEGTHEELIARGGRYWSLAQKQRLVEEIQATA